VVINNTKTLAIILAQEEIRCVSQSFSVS